MKLLSEPVKNDELSARQGRDVLMIDVVPVAAGDRLALRILRTSSEWRQGLWLGVVGQLSIGGERADQFEIWADTAPPEVDIEVITTADGLLRLYNIWDSGRGLRRESQSFTSGMIKAEVDGRLVYSANDIGVNPSFDKLVFEISRR